MFDNYTYLDLLVIQEGCSLYTVTVKTKNSDIDTAELTCTDDGVTVPITEKYVIRACKKLLKFLTCMCGDYDGDAMILPTISLRKDTCSVGFDMVAPGKDNAIIHIESTPRKGFDRLGLSMRKDLSAPSFNTASYTYSSIAVADKTPLTVDKISFYGELDHPARDNILGEATHKIVDVKIDDTGNLVHTIRKLK